MVAATYDEALKRLLVHEGGYTNHPADPGGPTNWGITIHDYRAYKKSDATAEDVRRMPLQDAKDIYRSKYWGAMRCDELPAGLDYAVFDYGVNSGIGRAAKVLHRVLGFTAAPQVFEGALIAAVVSRGAIGVPDLITKLCDERLAFLKSLHTWPTFGAGWGRRVAEVKAAALHMAAMASGIAPALPAPAPKVIVPPPAPDIEPVPSKPVPGSSPLDLLIALLRLIFARKE